MARKKKQSFNQGTLWFLVILLVSAFAAVYPIDPYYYVYLILAIAGALVAIVNIRIQEERDYLMAIIGLIVTVMGLSLVTVQNQMLFNFLNNLIVGFGVAGFIIAIAMISKVGLTR